MIPDKNTFLNLTLNYLIISINHKTHEPRAT